MLCMHCMHVGMYICLFVYKNKTHSYYIIIMIFVFSATITRIHVSLLTCNSFPHKIALAAWALTFSPMQLEFDEYVYETLF